MTDEDWDEDWEDEEFDESEAPERSSRERRRHLTGVCLGFLAMLPLLLVYEAGVQASDGIVRNTSELLVFRLFSPLGASADMARWITLAALTAASITVCYRREVAPVPGAARVVFEGALGALFIGPLIVWSLGLFGDGVASMQLHAGAASPSPGTAPGLAQASLVFGGAAYEELLFRVLMFSLVFLLTKRVMEFFGAPARAGRVLSEGMAAVCSSLLFAAFHLAAFLPASWGGGEEYDEGVFVWRVLAGLFLCFLFRWRGPGVAAWTHGLFNLALLVGAGPEVLL